MQRLTVTIGDRVLLADLVHVLDATAPEVLGLVPPEGWDYRRIRGRHRAGAVEDYPFGDEVAVRKVGGKMFALVPLSGTDARVKLKCDPAWAVELRKIHDAVQTGYHANKRRVGSMLSTTAAPARW